MSKYGSFVVIQDTREKEPWIFDQEEKKPAKFQLINTEVIGLEAADYSIKGLEDKFRIERKKSFTELFMNLCNKANRERFERELEKLKEIPHKYIIVESNLSDDILQLSVPQMGRFSPPGSRIVKMLLEYEIDYNIKIIYAGGCGKKIARYIFEEMCKRFL